MAYLRQHRRAWMWGGTFSIAVCLSSAAGASESCTPRLEIDPPRTIRYDPFAAEPAGAAIPLRIVEACPDADEGAALVGFFQPEGFPGRIERNGASLAFELLGRSGEDLLTPNRLTEASWASRAEPFVAISGPDGREFMDQVRLRLPPGQVVLPGSYTLELEAAFGNENTFREVTLLRAQIDVEPRAAIFIAGRDVRATFDFGELESGERKEVLLTTLSNVPYNIVMSTENGGTGMALAGTQWRAPYVATIDDEEIQDGGLIAGDVSKSAAGDRRVFKIEVGDVSNLRAGHYRDVITLSIEPTS